MSSRHEKNKNALARLIVFLLLSGNLSGTVLQADGNVFSQPEIWRKSRDPNHRIFDVFQNSRTQEYVFRFKRKLAPQGPVVVHLHLLSPKFANYFTKSIPLARGINIIPEQVKPGRRFRTLYNIIPVGLPALEYVSDTRAIIYTNERQLTVKGAVGIDAGDLVIWNQPFHEGYFKYTMTFITEVNTLKITGGNARTGFRGPREITFFYDRLPPLLELVPGSVAVSRRTLTAQIRFRDPGIFVKNGSGLKQSNRYYLETTIPRRRGTGIRTIRIPVHPVASDIFELKLNLNRYPGRKILFTGSNLQDRAGNPAQLSGISPLKW